MDFLSELNEGKECDYLVGDDWGFELDFNNRNIGEEMD